MANYTSELKKIFKEQGCEFFRQGKGDHEIWRDPRSDIKFVVDGNTKSRHTANAILKQAGLKKHF